MYAPTARANKMHTYIIAAGARWVQPSRHIAIIASYMGCLKYKDDTNYNIAMHCMFIINTHAESFVFFRRVCGRLMGN